MLVLASNSPRRKQLLSLTGWDFTVLPADVDESILPGELPQAYVRRLADTKALVVFSTILQEYLYPFEFVVIAADTAVVDGTEILGKPQDSGEAEAMLRRLRGRTHQVYTGLAVIKALGPAFRATNVIAVEAPQQTDICVSEVVMRNYSDPEMLAYVASGDPLDKAGAYAIQHAGFRPVERLQGCYANVMGLPLCHLARLLAEFGLSPAGDLVQSCQQALDAPCDVYARITGAAQ